MITIRPTSGCSCGMPARWTTAAQIAAKASAPPSTIMSRWSKGTRDSLCGASLSTFTPALTVGRTSVIGALRQCGLRRLGALSATRPRCRRRATTASSASSRPAPARWCTVRTGSPAATRSPGRAATLMPTPGSMTSSSRLRPAPSATAARPISSARSADDVSGSRRLHVGAVGRRRQPRIVVYDARVPALVSDHLTKLLHSGARSDRVRALSLRLTGRRARRPPRRASARRGGPTGSRGRAGRAP